MRSRLTAFLAVALLGPAAPAMAQETLYVAPNGLGTAPCAADQPQPCSLTTAVETVAQDGDTVVLTGGPYLFDAGATTLDVDTAITLLPEGSGQVVLDSSVPSPVMRISDGATLERITLTGPDTVLDLTSAAAGAQLRQVQVTQDDGGTGPALTSDSPDLVAQRLQVFGDDGLELGDGAPLIANSTLQATGEDGAALRANTDEGATLLHVTAVAPGTDANAVLLLGGHLAIVNSILLAAGTDLQVTSGDVVATRSSYGQSAGAGTVTDTGGQTGDPQLDVALRPAASSPVIDAGAGDPRSGAFDLAGAARVSRCAPDLGAFELQATCPAADDSQDPPGQPGPPTGPVNPPAAPQTPQVTFPGLLVGDFTDPVLSRLSVRASSRRRLTATLRSTEAVFVRFVIEKRIDGRRSGSRCVRGQRRGKRCTRWVVVRRLSRSLGSGERRTTLGGALSAGVYRVSARGQDSSRNQSGREVDTVRVRARRR